MHIAITGATGFLGLHLVRELLDRDDTWTLLANRNSAEPLGRITAYLELVGTPEPLVTGFLRRTRVVGVDIAKLRLGLDDAEYARLADEVEFIWHCAGDIKLDGDLDDLRQVNVHGTEAVLALAADARHEPVLVHTSTAFVAGALRDGIAFEDVLDDSAGFETPYERSKFEAEALVRRWAADHPQRTVLVMRPSILVTDRAPHPALPLHPLTYLDQALTSGARLLGLGGPRATADLPHVRLVGDPLGQLNLMPVEECAADMVTLADRAPGGLNTYNVVHHEYVPAPVMIDVLDRMAPVRLSMVPAPPADPSPLERQVKAYRGFAPYLAHRRLFDDTRTRTVIGEPEQRATVDLDYLLAGLGRAR